MKSNHLFLTLILLFASVMLSWAETKVDVITSSGSGLNQACQSGFEYDIWTEGSIVFTPSYFVLGEEDDLYLDELAQGVFCKSVSVTFAEVSGEVRVSLDVDESTKGTLAPTSGRKGDVLTKSLTIGETITSLDVIANTEAKIVRIEITWEFPDPVPPAIPVTYVSEENGLFYALAHDGANVTSIEVQMVDGMVICSATDQEKITWYMRNADDDWYDNGDYTLQTADDGKYLKLSRQTFSLVDVAVATCAFWTNSTSLTQANTTISCTSEGVKFDEYHPFGEIDVDASTFDNNVSAYTFSRTFNNTNYSTICLPYTVPAAKFSGFTLYNITGVERDSKTNKVTYFTMEESEVLEAGVPYIIQADAAGTVRLPYAGNRYTGSTRPVATGLVGNLTGATFQINASDNAYILSQNEAHLITGTATANIAAYRAYLDLNSVDAPASTSPRRVVLGVYETEQEDVVTDLDALLETAAVLDWSKPVYNLMGQRVSEGATGVLIQDGQKFMIR